MQTTLGAASTEAPRMRDEWRLFWAALCQRGNGIQQYHHNERKRNLSRLEVACREQGEEEHTAAASAFARLEVASRQSSEAAREAALRQEVEPRSYQEVLRRTAAAHRKAAASEVAGSPAAAGNSAALGFRSQLGKKRISSTVDSLAGEGDATID